MQCLTWTNPNGNDKFVALYVPENHSFRQPLIIAGKVQLYISALYTALDSPWYQMAPYMVVFSRGCIIAFHNTEFSFGSIPD